MSDINVVNTGDLNNWNAQKSYIEKLMDNNALTSAHPDNTLVLAGPPRLITNDPNFTKKILPIGMLQQIALTQRLPTAPVKAIGSGRLFYVSDKAQVGATIMRLYANGRNLLRVLYHNAVDAGVDVTKMDDIAAYKQYSKCFINLDSELFKVPFGLGVVIQDKLHNTIGSFYMELCMISEWSVQVTTGQSMIVENVSLMCDRIRPYTFENVGTRYNTENKTNIYKAVFGTDADSTQTDDTSETIADK